MLTTVAIAVLATLGSWLAGLRSLAKVMESPSAPTVRAPAPRPYRSAETGNRVKPNRIAAMRR